MKRLKGMPVGAWMLLMGGMAVIGLAGCGEPEPAAQPRPVSVKLMTVGHTSDRVRRYPGRVVAT